MEYNPFATRFADAQREIHAISNEILKYSLQLKKYFDYSENREYSILMSKKREAEEIRKKIEALRKRKDIEGEAVLQLTEHARLRLDPRIWFSRERIQLVRRRNEAKENLEHLDNSITNFLAEMNKITQECYTRQVQLEKHRACDPLELEGKIKTLDLHLHKLKSDLTKIEGNKQRVEKIIHPLLEKHSELSNLLTSHEFDVQHAENLENRLQYAVNGYEKALIHQECSSMFEGESRPSRVRQLRQKNIQSIRRHLNKIEERLKNISRIENREIHSIIIDGNNLCYKREEFIGLTALHSLTAALIQQYDVTVVFDASIRRLLGFDDQQVAYGFAADVVVHVVASRQAADETILDIASDSNTFVISNDRFQEYPEKSVILGKRLIRHEIVSGKIIVHDLHIIINYDDFSM